MSTPANRYMSSTAVTKVGTEMPMVANTMAPPSNRLPRRTADRMPSPRPTTTDTTTATAPTRAEIGKPRPMISFTEVSAFLKESPKSPVRKFLR